MTRIERIKELESQIMAINREIARETEIVNMADGSAPLATVRIPSQDGTILLVPPFDDRERRIFDSIVADARKKLEEMHTALNRIAEELATLIEEANR